MLRMILVKSFNSKNSFEEATKKKSVTFRLRKTEMNKQQTAQQKIDESTNEEDELPNLSSFQKNPRFIPQTIPTDVFPTNFPNILAQADLKRQNYEHDLFTGIDLIPDVPYDLADYQPQNPIEVPSYFPQMPNMKLLQPEFMSKFDNLTLFYIFYYFPGTQFQFFAGKELKKRNWVFHTKQQNWYHRLTEPVELTSEYQIAKFEYFDHSSNRGAWSINQINSFKFEFIYLEK